MQKFHLSFHLIPKGVSNKNFWASFLVYASSTPSKKVTQDSSNNPNKELPLHSLLFCVALINKSPRAYRFSDESVKLFGAISRKWNKKIDNAGRVGSKLT